MVDGGSHEIAGHRRERGRLGRRRRLVRVRRVTAGVKRPNSVGVRGAVVEAGVVVLGDVGADRRDQYERSDRLQFALKAEASLVVRIVGPGQIDPLVVYRGGRQRRRRDWWCRLRRRAGLFRPTRLTACVEGADLVRIGGAGLKPGVAERCHVRCGGRDGYVAPIDTQPLNLEAILVLRSVLPSQIDSLPIERPCYEIPGSGGWLGRRDGRPRDDGVQLHHRVRLDRLHQRVPLQGVQAARWNDGREALDGVLVDVSQPEAVRIGQLAGDSTRLRRVVAEDDDVLAGYCRGPGGMCRHLRWLIRLRGLDYPLFPAGGKDGGDREEGDDQPVVPGGPRDREPPEAAPTARPPCDGTFRNRRAHGV